MQAALAETMLPEENGGDDVDAQVRIEKNDYVDPTVANAGLTEIESKPFQPNGSSVDNATSSVVPEQATIDVLAANATAEEQWDSKITPTEGLGESFEMVPRNSSDVETKPAAIPASSSTPSTLRTNNAKSWADDNPVDPPMARDGHRNIPNGNDGFREVHHGRGGRNRGAHHGDFRGGFRGRYRGDGSGYRSRGYRGRGGGFRGGPRGRDNTNAYQNA